jgi:hypothetical protein
MGRTKDKAGLKHGQARSRAQIRSDTQRAIERVTPELVAFAEKTRSPELRSAITALWLTFRPSQRRPRRHREASSCGQPEGW